MVLGWFNPHFNLGAIVEKKLGGDFLCFCDCFFFRFALILKNEKCKIGMFRPPTRGGGNPSDGKPISNVVLHG